MKKIIILMLLLLIFACTPQSKEGKAAETPTQTETPQETKQEVEPITCCCEIQGTYLFLRKTECSKGGICVEDSKCLGKKEPTQAEKEKKIVDIAMDMKAFPTGDLTQRTCCVVKLDRAGEPYEKAFDTTRKRCLELKGTEHIWEKCYAEVCCDRRGRLVKRKFMECTQEGGKIVEKEKCL